jgi:adenylate cyclase
MSMMSDRWQIRVYEQQKLVCTADLTGPAELGRQSAPDEALYSQHVSAGRQRVVIAHKDEKTVSRQHALLEPLAEGGFRLTNLSAERPIGLPDGKNLNPRASCSVAPDALLTLGKKTVRLQGTGSQRLPLQGLAEPTVPPGQSFAVATPFSALPANATTSIETRVLMPWLQAAMDVLQSAASSADFFDKAARALVDLVNLDSGRVLLLHQDDWQTHALYTASRVVGQTTRPASRHVLNRVCQEKKTFWQVPDPSLPVAASLREVDAVVAAPILDRNGSIIGALYGDRHQESGPTFAGPITELEAMLVEVLARGVAAGLARLEQEQAALAARVQFEQFFTPELSRQLLRQPDLLKGRDAEVTILFCDIRGFSRISEHLGPARTVEWINEVMGALSDCVRAHAGVLVDYIGDELMAMWGAPEEQPDHARLACRAALEMLDQVPKLNDRWQTVLKEPMGIGIGVNTGLARVGNTGSHHKFKYGPLGNTVNLASRVQGATKYLKCKMLITGSTQRELDSSFATRRLCQVRVVNIAEPVALHELASSDQANWPEAKVEYEKALEEFESKNFSRAARILGNWRVQHPSDAPALLLLYRAVQCMVEEPACFDPVWVLPGK